LRTNKNDLIPPLEVCPIKCSVISGMTSRKADERAMYSASAVLKAILVCSLLAQ